MKTKRAISREEGIDLGREANILRCYECQNTCRFEEVKIVNRGGKKFWVCPHCSFETPMDEKKASHMTRIEKG